MTKHKFTFGPLFNSFIRKSFPGESRKIKRLIGSIGKKQVFMIIGPGASGKSVLRYLIYQIAQSCGLDLLVCCCYDLPSHPVKKTIIIECCVPATDPKRNENVISAIRTIPAQKRNPELLDKLLQEFVALNCNQEPHHD